MVRFRFDLVSVLSTRLMSLKATVGFVLVCITLIVSDLSAQAEDRTLSMYNIHTQETITVTFKKDGQYVPEALKKLNHFMRDWRRDLQTGMDPGLIDLIWELHKELGSQKPVHLICGYRSSETNETLRKAGGGQAKQSRHITGQAADMMFPDVPLKQLRYSALIRERGGVGYYPASGVPFVHVDTGNVRHWPRLPRLELAMLFPSGHTKLMPADGRPITREDAKLAQAKWRANGYEMAWALNKSAPRPMLASLGPSDLGMRAQPASLVSRAPDDGETSPSARPSVGNSSAGKLSPDSLAQDGKAKAAPSEDAEPLLAEEGDEQEDEIVFHPLPPGLLLAETSLNYLDPPEDFNRPEVITKAQMLIVSSSALANEDFDRKLQLEELYGSYNIRGRAIAIITQRRNRQLADAASGK